MFKDFGGWAESPGICSVSHKSPQHKCNMLFRSYLLFFLTTRRPMIMTKSAEEYVWRSVAAGASCSDPLSRI